MAAVEIRESGGTAYATSPPSTVSVTSSISTGGIPYTGRYTVTPTGEKQVLDTAMKVLSRDITVNPIPSNYGRIEYDGSVLTVS